MLDAVFSRELGPHLDTKGGFKRRVSGSSLVERLERTRVLEGHNGTVFLYPLPKKQRLNVELDCFAFMPVLC
jgi:hypothetical protein